jgi:hypothetical protein
MKLCLEVLILMIASVVFSIKSFYGSHSMNFSLAKTSIHLKWIRNFFYENSNWFEHEKKSNILNHRDLSLVFPLVVGLEFDSKL